MKGGAVLLVVLVQGFLCLLQHFESGEATGDEVTEEEKHLSLYSPQDGSHNNTHKECY